MSDVTLDDPLEHIPPPEIVRVMLAETIRRRELLRSLLRVAVRKANYPAPLTTAPATTSKEGCRNG